MFSNLYLSISTSLLMYINAVDKLRTLILVYWPVVLYISGTVVEERGWSMLGFGAIPELIWGAVEFVSLL